MCSRMLGIAILKEVRLNIRALVKDLNDEELERIAQTLKKI